MTYILIIVIFYQTPTVHKTEFLSRATCEAARDQIEQDIIGREVVRIGTIGRYSIRCFPKGDTK